MRSLLVMVTFLLVGSALFAQDNIIFFSGEEVQAKVEEISQTEVAYHRFDNLDGPLYRVDRNTIFMIQYANGTSEVITAIDLSQPVPSNGERGDRRLIGSDYKSPGMAFLFSFLLPGGGQYYNHQFGKGATMTGLWLGGIVTSATSWRRYADYSCGYYYEYDSIGNVIGEYYDDCYYNNGADAQRIVGNIVWTGSWIWSMIDAPISAARINRRNADAATAGLLDFRLNQATTMHIRPFRSNGLGGTVAFRF